MAEAQGIWIVTEQENGELRDISLELVSLGRSLADKLGQQLSALVLGNATSDVAETMAHYGADRVCLVESPLLTTYNPEAYAAALWRLANTARPWALLFGATEQGQDVAPRVAARLRVGLVSRCVHMDLNPDRQLLMVRLAYDGKVECTVCIPNARPQMATIQPGTVEAKRLSTPRKAEMIRLPGQVSPEDIPTHHVGVIRADPKTLDITEAEVIVAGGRGVGKKENFHLVEELAQELGAAVGGSRVAVDEGWIPFARQIGLSGKVVAPKLIISCGISGATQHAFGMKDSKLIVAINKDRGAPIFKLADVGILGDLRELLPALIQQLREAKAALAKEEAVQD